MSITTIDDFVSAVANNDTMKLLTFHTQYFSSKNSPLFDINSTDATGDTAIEVAITTSNHKLLKLLLERFKCDPNISGLKRNQTPLRLAARKNDAKSCQLLCQFGADVNATTSSSGSASKNEEDDVEDGWTALHVAVFGMKKDTIKFFLDTSSFEANVWSKIDFSTRTKREGATVLHFACAQGLHETVGDILTVIKKQQDEKNIATITNLQDNNGDTCLHSALHFRIAKSLAGRYSPPEHPQWSIAMTLIVCGFVDPSIKNNTDETATHFLSKELPQIDKVFQLFQQISSSCNATLISYEQLPQAKDREELSNTLQIPSVSQSLADEVFEAIKSLEGARNEKNEKAKKEHLAAAAEQKKKSSAETYDKTIDPHGMGIDIKNLKPGEDPSHGECPFLAIRAAQQQQRNNNNNQVQQQQQDDPTKQFSASHLIIASSTSFLIGVVVGGLFLQSFFKK